MKPFISHFRKTGRLKIGLAALALFWAAAQAQAATVYLKDGGVLNGTIVSGTATELHLAIAGGTITIPADKILRVDYSDAAAPAAQPQPPEAPAAAPQPGLPMETGPAAEPAPEPQEPRYIYVRHRRRYVEPLDLAERSHEFSFELGTISPLNDLDFSNQGGGRDTNGGPGGLFGFQYLYFPSPRFGWGFGLDFFDRGHNYSENLLPSSVTNVFGDTTLLMALMKYTLVPQGPIRPYLLGGLGAGYNSMTIDATPDNSFGPTERLVDDAAWTAAASLKLGIDFSFLSPYTLGLEAGWTGLNKVHYAATSDGRAAGINGVSAPLDIFSLALRWGWRF